VADPDSDPDNNILLRVDMPLLVTHLTLRQTGRIKVRAVRAGELLRLGSLMVSAAPPGEI
jgi:hypothetical protein